MDIVIDASAIIAVIANEPEKPALIECTRGVDLIAPVSIHFEIGNAFSAMLKRRRSTVAQLEAALAIYHTIPIRFVEIELRNSLQIAAQLELYAYDAYLIRCAERYHSPLLTLDQALREQSRRYGISIEEVTT